MLRSWLLLLLLVVGAVTADDRRPVLALVIDDLGYSFEPGRKALELSGDHTYAILPDAVYSRKLARHAYQLDREVILHLPMQSINSNAAHEPGALNEAMDEDELTLKVHSLLASVPHIRGVNNHMGSHLTEYDFFMRPVMDSIRSYNPSLYFLDSRTSPRSVAYSQALEAGLDTISRDVFLDNELSLEAINRQYDIWLAQAREQGFAIAIGHPHANTLEVLQKRLAESGEEFRFMRISELIEAHRAGRLVPGWDGQVTTLGISSRY